ncbi:hypothetical protein [Bathymodiolus septemdierum thioautotrophic gill symbiont]|uniref:Transmembrane protein n=1 Tax=endosymbiont of Bathymodiolus septemdierum str. Myojin knoll TaxID=1303921 RepID=A0A0P0UQM2_9GAMM|nr:hypothetical protein [Bathymodiolus septemdierum thioautotrophic gill symbiont]BAS67068.1 conserved hypothetical protein [endosymbiont of Bathymodiolus septemdierum str. Myojin knoll]
MNSKKELWILLASFVLPIALGTAFFYWNPTAFTGTTVNYGEFVNPIITTSKEDVRFSEKTKGTLQGLWTLAYVSKNCDSGCKRTLKDMKTIRTLMNEDMRRIQRMLLIDGTTNVEESGLLVAYPSVNLSQQLKRFPNNTLYLIDPLGNVMLRYNPQDLVIKRVLKDLKRLFKYSRIG